MSNINFLVSSDFCQSILTDMQRQKQKPATFDEIGERLGVDVCKVAYAIGLLHLAGRVSFNEKAQGFVYYPPPRKRKKAKTK